MNKAATALAILLTLAVTASADDYSADWFTIAGGGVTLSTGGEFSLGGTIAQHSTDALTGGEFVLHGGFWLGVPSCSCEGDVSGNLKSDGLDIRLFIQCLTQQLPDCSCADMNFDASVDVNDISVFVSKLLTGPGC